MRKDVVYIHQLKGWPNLTWDRGRVAGLLAEARYLQGALLGKMSALGFNLCEEATLKILTQDVLKTSEIEGEKLDAGQVRSSIASRLGIDIGLPLQTSRAVDGIVEIMLDATRNYNVPLTEERLWEWHRLLFPGKRTWMNRLVIGRWRDETGGLMQVVSGPIGRETVHYEAPSFERLEEEMGQFIAWINNEAEMDLVIKSAVAHFWFVTIHPFDDGNGRIGRAIADMLLAKSERSVQRFYSMSAQIQKERNAYYNILEKCQKGPSLDITEWVEWFLGCFKRAIGASDAILELILKKAAFWQLHGNEFFNERQRRLVNCLIDGFEGKLTSSKWAKIGKCSQDTALRDINDLLERNILKKDEAGGRSVGYYLVSFEDDLGPGFKNLSSR